jgi:hypothetical protein
MVIQFLVNVGIIILSLPGLRSWHLSLLCLRSWFFNSVDSSALVCMCIYLPVITSCDRCLKALMSDYLKNSETLKHNFISGLCLSHEFILILLLIECLSTVVLGQIIRNILNITFSLLFWISVVSVCLSNLVSPLDSLLLHRILHFLRHWLNNWLMWHLLWNWYI